MIKLWEIPTEELLRTGLKGLLPLLPLTQEGQRREVVEEAIARLTRPGEGPNGELLALVYGLASLAFEDESEQEWLVRRFNMLYEILRDTRAFQEMAKEGLQEALLALVEARFPDPQLIQLVKDHVSAIEDPHTLQKLIVKAGTAQNAEEMRNYLLKESFAEDR